MGAAIEVNDDVRFSRQCGSVTTTWLNVEWFMQLFGDIAKLVARLTQFVCKRQVEKYRLTLPNGCRGQRLAALAASTSGEAGRSTALAQRRQILDGGGTVC
jgi:hypothetical protein